MSAREDAIRKLASAADDWGWKGGKPGEISGTEVWDYPSGTYVKFLNQIKNDEYLSNLVPYDPGSKYLISEASNRALDIANGFRTMEQAGLPRQYTGKLYKALIARSGAREPVGSGDAWVASRLMQDMTQDQRENFLNLLPTWRGEIEKAASVAKRVMGTQTSRRPR